MEPKVCGTLLPPGGNIWKVMRRLNPEVLIWPKHKTERAGLETCISETKLWVNRTINLERNLVITEFNYVNFQMRKLRFRDTLWLTWRYFRATASSSPIKCNFPFNPPLKKMSLLRATEVLINWQNGEQLNIIAKSTKGTNFCYDPCFVMSKGLCDRHLFRSDNSAGDGLQWTYSFNLNRDRCASAKSRKWSLPSTGMGYHLFIFMDQIQTKYCCFASCCARCWEYNEEKTRREFCFHGAHSLIGKMDELKCNYSYASHNYISVNEELCIQQWSHKMIMELKKSYLVMA